MSASQDHRLKPVHWSKPKLSVKADSPRNEGERMSDTEKALRLLDQQVGNLKGTPKKISKEEVWASFLKEIE